jgi:beta-mannosidase
MAPISIGLKRACTSTPANKYTRVNVKTEHKIEMWASNLSIRSRTVDVIVKCFDIATGKQTYAQTIHLGLVIEENRSTELGEFEVPVKEKNKGEEMRVVVAAYLIEDGRQIARYVNWPEPLKYAQLRKPKRLNLKISETGNEILLEAEVPVKGVVIEAEDDGIVFADNCVDVVPGERVRVGVDGLRKGDEGKLGMRYLGF